MVVCWHESRTAVTEDVADSIGMQPIHMRRVVLSPREPSRRGRRVSGGGETQVVMRTWAAEATRDTPVSYASLICFICLAHLFRMPRSFVSYASLICFICLAHLFCMPSSFVSYASLICFERRAGGRSIDLHQVRHLHERFAQCRGGCCERQY